MKIAVISDIHGNGIALECALNDIRALGINKLIILGDIVMKGPLPQISFELIRKSNLEILAWIQGNTEEWLENVELDNNSDQYMYTQYAVKNMNKESIEYLLNLPHDVSLNIKGVKVLCVHGTPKSNVSAIDSTVSKDIIRKEIEGVDADLILSGHSHTSFIGEVDKKKIFNVGSVENSLDGDKRISYGILEFNDADLLLTNRRVEYQVKEIIKAARKNDFPYLDQYEGNFK